VNELDGMVFILFFLLYYKFLSLGMIELYVALSLMGLGYVFNQNKAVMSNLPFKLDPHDIPSQDSLHSSNHTQTVKKIEAEKAQKMIDGSKTNGKDYLGNQKIPNVIDKNYGYDRLQGNTQFRQKKDRTTGGKDTMFSPLKGCHVPKEEFAHNNMVPFFKNRNTQSMKPDAFQERLENFTGTPQNYKPKVESKSFFKPKKNMGNVNGMPSMTDFEQSRIAVPLTHNNVLPFRQEQVGPGLNLDYNSGPTGGFDQHEIRDFVLPKTTDQLRTKNNPKVLIGASDNQKETYEGRVVEGQKGSERGKVGLLAKNRPDRFYKNTPDMYLKTTGAYLKGKQAPKYDAKDTNRQDTSTKEYKGVAFDKSKQAWVKSEYSDTNRQNLGPLNKGHASITSKGKGSDFDHGKKNIQVYANQRDTTTMKTYEGNVMSLVKAMIAPFDDIAKFSKKEYLVDNPRTYGQMSAQMPSKATAYDPNDVARTTIKETTLSEAEKMNLKGHNKGYVYDPNDVARTTVKETTLSDAEKMNLTGPVRAYVYDPNDIARTTVKETTLSEAEKMNFKGHNKGFVYDPNDIARTTTKETTLSEAEKMNLKGHTKNYVYDPNDIARTTTKETTLSEAEKMNLRGNRTAGMTYTDDPARTTIRQTLDNGEIYFNLTGNDAGYVYDPNDVARTTIKETTIDNDYTGIVDGHNDSDGYRIAPTDMKYTHKQFLSDNDYIGGVDGSYDADGYRVAPTDIKDTSKQFLSDNEHFGIIGDNSSYKQQSFENMYNAEIDDGKEVLLEGRDPVYENTKIALGADSINADTRRHELDYDDIFERQFENKERLSNNAHGNATYSQDNFTKQKCGYGRIDDRMDIGEMRPHNPFVTSII
jgi:hypothetical protein